LLSFLLHCNYLFYLAKKEEDAMSVRTAKGLLVACLVLSIGFLFSCAGREFAPKEGIWYYHSELPAADRALAAAKAAGKDKECPDAYKNVEKMRDDAYKTYWACRTKEAIAQANEATAKAKGLCPKPPPPPPVAAPPPPPPPMAAPTVSLMASPSSVEKGKCADLSWTSTNASDVSIDQGIGGVAASGSRQVCPDTTTQYMVTAKGEGGTKTASTTLNVVAPPPAAPVPIDKLTIHVNFDVDKAQVRKEDVADLQKALAFVKKYPGYKISVEGHTDSTGSEKYNQTLSEKRAEAVKKYLLANGASDGDKIETVGFGETKPIASNKTAKGRFENRRVEILIFSR
jgi:peptidoglycan-associated lipoprotein